MLFWIALFVSVIVFLALFFGGGEGRKLGLSLLRDQAGGVGNRFAYGNVALGLFEKLLNEARSAAPPASWSQATWFIDPQNVTGTANDANSGVSAAQAVRSYNGGIVAKWGTPAPLLAQNTTFTWLSSQPDESDPVVFRGTLEESIALFQGDPASATVLHTGNLGGVVPKNRATPQLLEADLGFVAPIGSLVRNLTPGKESLAWVYKHVAGNVFLLSQPLAPLVVPLISLAPAEVDTWANGDAFDVVTPVGVHFVDMSPRVAKYVEPTFPDQLQIYQVHGLLFGGASSNNTTIGNDVAVLESVFDSVFVDVTPLNDQFSVLFNVAALGGVWMNTGTGIQAFWGGIILSPVIPSVCQFSIDFDTILDTTGGGGISVGYMGSPPGTAPIGMGSVYIDGTINVYASMTVGIGGGALWGPGNLNVEGSSRLAYPGGAGAAVATFKQTGTLRINGQANGNTFVPATGIWSAAIAITPANLDDAAQLHGLAVNVGGGSITNQDTP